MKNIIITILVVALAVIAGVLLLDDSEDSAFATYTNERFGYTFEYPEYLAAQGEPTNADGQVFSAEGIELRVFGANNVDDETLEEVALSYIEDLDDVEIAENADGSVTATVVGTEETTIVKVIDLGDGQVGVLELSFADGLLADETIEHILDSFEPVDAADGVGDDGEVDTPEADGEEGETDEEADAPAGGDVVESYEPYTSDELGFSIPVPETATIDSPVENRVRIRLVGPDAIEDSEITDGFMLTVFDDPQATNYTNLENYAEAVAAEENAVDELERREVSGYEAYRFSYKTELGTTATSYVLLPAPGEGYVATYSVSDPQERGYQAVIFTMLEQIEFMVDDDSDETAGMETVQVALLDYPAVGDRYTRESDGEERGCDRVVMVEREIPETQAVLTASLDELFSLDDTEVAGWQNFIAQVNDTLEFDRATIVDGTANIYLEGELAGLGGVCDNPRAAIQITETAQQFATVEDVQLYLNGEPTDLIPGGREE